MPTSDHELPETLDLIARLVASASDRLDQQGEVLDRLAEAHERIEPQRIATATAAAVCKTLLPELHKIVDTMEGLTGGKALRRERLRALNAEEARQGRWRVQPWAVVLGIPLALGVLLAVLMPSAVAQTAFTCRAVGGIWWVATERYPAACTFKAQGRLNQATEETDAGSS